MKNKKGFTLIEIIVTVCIVAVLMSLIVPGLMNYFGDVDEDKYITETKSVVARIQTSRAQISLSGSLGSRELDVTTANEIVKDANGQGVIKKIKEENGVLEGEYWINESVFVTFRVDGKNDKYFMGDKEDDDIFQ